jgi:hypothetical protein
VQLAGFDGFVNHRWRAAEAFALLPGVSASREDLPRRLFLGHLGRFGL